MHGFVLGGVCQAKRKRGGFCRHLLKAWFFFLRRTALRSTSKAFRPRSAVRAIAALGLV